EALRGPRLRDVVVDRVPDAQQPTGGRLAATCRRAAVLGSHGTHATRGRRARGLAALRVAPRRFDRARADPRAVGLGRRGAGLQIFVPLFSAGEGITPHQIRWRAPRSSNTRSALASGSFPMRTFVEISQAMAAETSTSESRSKSSP